MNVCVYISVQTWGSVVVGTVEEMEKSFKPQDILNKVVGIMTKDTDLLCLRSNSCGRKGDAITNASTHWIGSPC